jgi:hypothetical protein
MESNVKRDETLEELRKKKERKRERRKETLENHQLRVRLAESRIRNNFCYEFIVFKDFFYECAVHFFCYGFSSGLFIVGI